MNVRKRLKVGKNVTARLYAITCFTIDEPVIDNTFITDYSNFATAGYYQMAVY